MQNGLILSLTFYFEKKNDFISTSYISNNILFDKAIEHSSKPTENNQIQ